jgi:putative ABC transport system permease protein
MKFLPLVWSGLWRKPARTLFTLLSLALGFLLFGLLQGVDSAFDGAVARQRLDRLLTDPRFGAPLPLSYGPTLEKVPHVTNLTWTVFLPGYVQEPQNNFLVIATAPGRFFKVRHEYQTTPEQLAALESTRTGLIVLKKSAEVFGWKIGDRVTLKSPVPRKDGGTDWTFDVVGLLDNPDNPGQIGFAVAHYEYFDEARAMGNGTVGRYVIRIDEPRRSVEVSRAIDKLFESSAAPTRTQTENERAQSQLATIGDVGLFTRAIIAAVFFAILFLTGNTVLQSVRERGPELAVLKTLGFSDSTVFGIVIAETFLLCLVAAAAGLAGASVLFPVVSANLLDFSAYVGSAPFFRRVLVEGFALALVLAVLSAVVPAWRTTRLRIVDALVTK